MAVPTTTQPVTDRQGRPIAVGDNVRAPGVDGPAVVQEIDPRYGTVIVLVAGRANQQMGRMFRADSLERL
jgi:hypothetical protein